jgi:hypothetical protein
MCFCGYRLLFDIAAFITPMANPTICALQLANRVNWDGRFAD